MNDQGVLDQPELGPYWRQSWRHLIGQILLGLAEIAIPIAFVAGFVYWRWPWLFWAAVHFLKGEPIFSH